MWLGDERSWSESEEEERSESEECGSEARPRSTGWRSGRTRQSSDDVCREMIDV